MIKKTFLTTLLLFLLYWLFVEKLAPKWWHASQHQWQDNIINAQSFLYDDDKRYQTVVIGTSLSVRLITDSLPAAYNLSFNGQGIFDGLRILRQKDTKLKNVLIETNFVLREESKEFTSYLLSPVLYYSRRKIPSLMANKQPIAVIGSQISFRITEPFLRSMRSFVSPLFGETQRNDGGSTRVTLFEKVLENHHSNFNNVPDEKKIMESFEKLKIYVNELEKRNINVVFYEMPVDSSLQKLPMAVNIRNCFSKYFSEDRYKYIKLEQGTYYQTTDGIHLTNAEAIRYMRYFKREVMKNTR